MRADVKGDGVAVHHFSVDELDVRVDGVAAVGGAGDVAGFRPTGDDHRGRFFLVQVDFLNRASSIFPVWVLHAQGASVRGGFGDASVSFIDVVSVRERRPGFETFILLFQTLVRWRFDD